MGEEVKEHGLNYEKINRKAKLIHSTNDIPRDSMRYKGKVLILNGNKEGE
jgi:hypothetical protein